MFLLWNCVCFFCFFFHSQRWWTSTKILSPTSSQRNTRKLIKVGLWICFDLTVRHCVIISGSITIINQRSVVIFCASPSLHFLLAPPQLPFFWNSMSHQCNSQLSPYYSHYNSTDNIVLFCFLHQCNLFLRRCDLWINSFFLAVSDLKFSKLYLFMCFFLCFFFANLNAKNTEE